MSLVDLLRDPFFTGSVYTGMSGVDSNRTSAYDPGFGPSYYNPDLYDNLRHGQSDVSVSSPSFSGNGSTPVTPQQITYFDAPMAEKYGMSAATAYQEALANTAYQRKVADLKAAGLNPVLGISGSGAGGVYGASSGQPLGSVSSGYSVSKASKDSSVFKAALPYFINGAAALISAPFVKSPQAAIAIGNAAGTITSGLIRSGDR